MKKGIDYIGVGVGGAIINDNKEILLFLRNKDPENGFWSIPGGSVEYGESVENALVRELYEELGVKVEIISLLGVANHIIKEKGSHWVSPEFHVKIVSGTPKNMEIEKHTKMLWFSLDKLPEKLAIPAVVAIEGYKRIYNK